MHHFNVPLTIEQHRDALHLLESGNRIQIGRVLLCPDLDAGYTWGTDSTGRQAFVADHDAELDGNRRALVWAIAENDRAT